ncbi:MAG: hydroxymethylbilane synthase [Acidobacteriota bacterium]
MKTGHDSGLTLRLGTRGSRLARAQSAWVATRLERLGHSIETVIVETRGDADRDRPFAQIGAPGLFVRELEHALQAGRVDLVVHSFKDLPSISPPGLIIAAVPERLDPADHLLIRPEALQADRDGDLLPLIEGARVGTASARRRALVRHLRPDVEVGLLRGNVPTRLDKLRRGEHDAILLAGAGLERLDRAGGLDRHDILERRLDPTVFVPAPAQGALALQVRDGGGADGRIRQAVTALDEPAVHRAVTAERELLARAEGDCSLAFGAWCRLDGGMLRMDAVLGTSGGDVRRVGGTGDDPRALAASLAPTLLGRAAGERPEPHP